MMLSSEYIQLKICKTFCQTPRNGFDFDDGIWFDNGSQPLPITDTVKHSGKDNEKNFKSFVAVSTLHKLEYIFVICKWPYLVIPMSRVLCQRLIQHKTVTGALDGMLRHYFSTSKPVNQRRAYEYVLFN